MRSSKAAYAETALQAAANNDHGNVVRLLLDFGADINAEVCGTSATYAAASNGHQSVVCLLISQGAKVENLTGFVNSSIQFQLSTQRANWALEARMSSKALATCVAGAEGSFIETKYLRHAKQFFQLQRAFLYDTPSFRLGKHICLRLPLGQKVESLYKGPSE